MCWALGHHIKHFFLTQIHTFCFKLALNSFSGLRTQKNYSGGLHMLSALLLFFQGQRHKRPWIKYQKASDQMANCGFFSSLKSASSCTENKCCLCPLEAADRPSTHRQLFRPLIHTHKHKTVCIQFALDFINEVYGSSLHMSCLSSCKQHAHTQVNLYSSMPSPGGPVNVTHAHSACGAV